MEFNEIYKRLEPATPGTDVKPCIMCKELPPDSRLYRSNIGEHILCETCLQKLNKNGSAHGLNSSPSGTTIQIACKPFKCPHGACGKTLNSSSVKMHFLMDHTDITNYSIKRGEQLNTITNVAMIEHHMTNCIGLIEVFDERKVAPQLVEKGRKQHEKFSVGIFLVLVSGSAEQDHAKSYALYWLASNSELPFKCSLEVSSPINDSKCATDCEVNHIRDEMAIRDASQRSNCLYLTYSSLRNLKGTWGDIKLRIAIY